MVFRGEFAEDWVELGGVLSVEFEGGVEVTGGEFGLGLEDGS